MIDLRSDNTSGVAPEILEAIAAANSGRAAAYGADEDTERLHEVVREVFEHPEARVFPVVSGTAANALGISAMTPPWGAVLCHETAHIIRSEGGATSLLAAGAVMHGVGGEDFLVSPAALRSALESVRWGDPHDSQPSVLALTQPSDFGTVYTPAQVGELAAIAREYGMRVQLDGARFANALAALGCSPADLTWRAGVEVMTLGATKNGALSTDAIVVFDDKLAEELRYRTKRSGHVASKMRFQSAQLIAYLTDGLWLRLAAQSNARMAELAAGIVELAPCGARTVNRVDVNMLFAELPPAMQDALDAAGVLAHRIGSLHRFVTSWQTTREEIAEVVALLTTACRP